jgi:ASCH domain
VVDVVILLERQLTMKALSIHQPWAWAIFHAGKNVENRCWRTHYRGPLLIHAAKSRASYNRQDAKAWRERYGIELPAWESLTTGAIIGVVEVVDCVGGERDLPAIKASLWAETDSWCWVLRNPMPFPTAIPRRGMQQLFEVSEESFPSGVLSG